MQLTPRYDGPPLLRIEADPATTIAATIGQRSRLCDRAGRFSEEEWATPSRCEGWSARDVLIHLTSTNDFWSLSINAGVSGRPTRFLSEFDPVATPALIVAAKSDQSNAAVLEEFRRSTDEFSSLLGEVGTQHWDTTVETPAGHVPLHTLVHHALWDAWLHEADIVAPLGEQQPRVDAEVIAALKFACGGSAALMVSRERRGHVTYAISTKNPSADLYVSVADSVEVTTASDGPAEFIIEGDATELIEALSARRAPLDLAPAWNWVAQGFVTAFDQA